MGPPPSDDVKIGKLVAFAAFQCLQETGQSLAFSPAI